MLALAKLTLKYALFPVLMMAGILLSFSWLHQGRPLFLIIGVIPTVIFLIVWGAEHVIPYKPEWNKSDGQRWNDIFHAAFGTALGARLGHMLTDLIFAGASVYLAGWLAASGSLWPSSLPYPLQILLVYLLADLGRYVQHRLHHQVPWLWEFHSLHHSGAQLNVFKTSRSHLVERVIQQLFMFGPLLLLGVPQELLLCYIIPDSLLGPFAHSNTDIRLGPLEYLIMGPSAHRIHHSEDREHGMTNFSSSSLIWDHIFGTYTNPVRVRVERVGIAADTTSPKLAKQLVAPFQNINLSLSRKFLN